MQFYPKITLENLDSKLKKLSKFVFDIDNESRIILGIIAKNGESTEYKLSTLGNNRFSLSREIIRRRLLLTDLTDGFVSNRKGKRIRNIGKQERIFSLTLKGILGSLFETKLSENFLIRNYIVSIEKMTNNVVSQLLLENIYYCITCYMILYANSQGSLKKSTSVPNDIKSNYDSFGRLHNIVFSGSDVKGINSNYQDLFVSSAIEFFISCHTLSNLIHDLKLPSNYLVEYADSPKDPSRFIEIFFENWMYSIFEITKKTPRRLFEEHLEKIEKTESLNFSKILGFHLSDKIEKLAEQSYRQLNPKGKFDPAKSLLFPKPI